MVKKIVGILVVLALLVGGVLGYTYYKAVIKSNVRLTDADYRYFYIRTNASFDDVVDGLTEQGLLESKSSFVWLAKQKKYDKNVKPGRFKIDRGMSNNDLINHLRSSNIPVEVTFNNIQTIGQLTGVIGRQLELDSNDLYDLLMDEATLRHYGFSPQTLPALFIPNTYEFYWNTNEQQFLDRMAREFKVYWTQERKSLAKSKGLSQSEVSTLASIVEGETKKVDEMPKVAGLYLNRLRIGMPLQSDPTVKFALQDPTRRRIYNADLQIDSPYNTYKNKGLPPGPIGFPSTMALNAVLNAANHDYIYMVAKPDYSGYHNFAKSYSQHLRYAREYRSFLNREQIR